MTISLEKRKEHYRTIYELLWSQDPRMYIKDIAASLHIDPRSASNRLKEAYNLGFVSHPQIRKRSYANMREYLYFVNCNYPYGLYKQLSKDINVVYHAVMGGFANFWIVTKEKIEFEGTIVVEGPRSDYFTAFAPDHSWRAAVQIMEKKVENFSLKDYDHEGIIKNRGNDYISWDEEDEVIYRYFKYNLRKPFTPLMKEHLISTGKIYKWLDRLPECCTTSTRYYPEGASAYDPYIFMFETAYEDFIVDFFSQLSTSTLFFKVSDRLFMLGSVERSSLRRVGLDMSDVSQLHIPRLVDALLEKGILKSEAHAVVEYSCAKDL